MLTLYDIPCEASARILSISESSTMYQRLSDLGFIPNTIIKPLFKSPLGEPTAFSVRGSVIVLRREYQKQIFVEVV